MASSIPEEPFLPGVIHTGHTSKVWFNWEHTFRLRQLNKYDAHHQPAVFLADLKQLHFPVVLPLHLEAEHAVNAENCCEIWATVCFLTVVSLFKGRRVRNGEKKAVVRFLQHSLYPQCILSAKVNIVTIKESDAKTKSQISLGEAQRDLWRDVPASTIY